MSDLTCIFLTCNELPSMWQKYHQKVLLEAVGDFPLITMSMKPTNLGLNILQEKPKSPSNVYWQILRACKVATTEYIAIAEDDSLYPREHFLFRPDKGKIGYNMSHWSLFTWGKPTYSWRNRLGNYTMIAERELIIEALEERFAKYPNGTPDKITGEVGRPLVDKNLGVTPRQAQEFNTKIPIINFNHDYAMDDLQRRHWKAFGTLTAYDIPHWGRAEDLVKHFK